jgi:hypothetical protein
MTHGGAHGGGAHALGALVGAITERPVLASIGGDEIPMLDLDAHRLGPWSPLVVGHDRASRQAATLGIARTRITRVDHDAQGTAELLARRARGSRSERRWGLAPPGRGSPHRTAHGSAGAARDRA